MFIVSQHNSTQKSVYGNIKLLNLECQVISIWEPKNNKVVCLFLKKMNEKKERKTFAWQPLLAVGPSADAYLIFASVPL